jgi:hypothetical protein
VFTADDELLLAVEATVLLLLVPPHCCYCCCWGYHIAAAVGATVSLPLLPIYRIAAVGC